MPIPTNIKYSKFVKVVEIIVKRKFHRCNIVNKPGSGRRFDLFFRKEDLIPSKMWVIHEAKYIYSDDLKKTCANLGVNKEEFIEIANSL